MLTYSVIESKKEEGGVHKVVDNFQRLVYPTPNKEHAKGVAKFLNDIVTTRRDGVLAWVDEYFKV